MKYIKYFLFTLVIIPTIVFAYDIDTTKKSKMTITYQFGEKKITDTDIYLYKIATYDRNAKATYTSEFDLSYNLDVHTAAEVLELASQLNNYIKENNIDYFSSCTTDGIGKCSFNDLNVGIYLIVANSKAENEYQYFANPSLVGIPSEESSEELKYDIDVILKTESKSVGCPDCLPVMYTIKTRAVNGRIYNENLEVEKVLVKEEGKDVTITYSPHKGYRLVSVTIDNVSVDIEKYPDTYTFEQVDKDHEIVVVYEQLPDEIIPTPPGIPKTLDEIFTYVFILCLSVIIVILLAIYTIKINKNKKGSNEKNEKNK